MPERTDQTKLQWGCCLRGSTGAGILPLALGPSRARGFALAGTTLDWPAGSGSHCIQPVEPRTQPQPSAKEVPTLPLSLLCTLVNNTALVYTESRRSGSVLRRWMAQFLSVAANGAGGHSPPLL